MSATEWRDKTYDETYELTYKALLKTRAEDPEHALSRAEGVLAHLYVNDGNDQFGRGGVQDALMEATIDAHERFIAELRAADRPAAP